MPAKTTEICPFADRLGSRLCAQEDRGKSLELGPVRHVPKSRNAGYGRKVGTVPRLSCLRLNAWIA